MSLITTTIGAPAPGAVLPPPASGPMFGGEKTTIVRTQSVFERYVAPLLYVATLSGAVTAGYFVYMGALNLAAIAGVGAVTALAIALLFGRRANPTHTLPYAPIDQAAEGIKTA